MDEGDMFMYEYEIDGTKIEIESKTFEEGLEYIINNPKTVYTDDRGFFRRAFNNKYDSDYWKDYDAYLAIAIAGSISVFLWIVHGVIDIIKYKDLKWNFACYVFFLLL